MKSYCDNTAYGFSNYSFLQSVRHNWIYHHSICFSSVSESRTSTMAPPSKRAKKANGNEPSSSESNTDLTTTADQESTDTVLSEISLPVSNPLYEPPNLNSDQKEFIKKINQSRKNWGSPLIFPFRTERVRPIIPAKSPQPISPSQCVLYWMSRDTRVQG